MNAVELRNVTKSFGPTIAVDGLDLDIRQGVIHGFLGPNGSGKTTTIRMILSILYPDDGQVSVLGKASAHDSKQRIGYLPEERGLYPKMKVGAFLSYLASLKGVPSQGMRDRVLDWLERVELADKIDTPCEDLSRGMKQKVQTLQALIHQPDLLILDEPFSGLDPVNRRLMADLFLAEAERGCTLILCTHMMHHAEELCDHIVMMNLGRKVLDGPIREVRKLESGILQCEPVSDHDPDSLLSIPGVKSVRRDAHELRIHLEAGVDGSTLIPDVTRIVPCSRIEIERPSLEDVFIETVAKAKT